jgi:hypothetical protein
MARLADICQAPEAYLGYTDDPISDRQLYELFYAAVEVLMDQDLGEEEAIEEVFGDGDWVPRAEQILAS